MDSLAPGTVLGRRYRLLDRIGVGGMSVIWRAQDEMLERSVAVKVLASDLAADSRFRDLVRTEARAAAALVHPYLTATYDYGETVNTDGEVTAYVVMELLEGEPLSRRLAAGPLAWPEALRICADVAEAIAAAHRHGIVHRDVTADNVMLTDGGTKVLDFGIATTVGAPDEDTDGLTFGTPAYVAPERLDGRHARTANDTYALGVLLFETLTGSPPYPAETWDDLARRGEPPPLELPGLPEPVATLCRRCLAVDPQQRPTAHQVAWTLRRSLPGAGRRVRSSNARRALAAAGATAALLLGALLGTTVLSPGQDPKPQTQAPSGDDRDGASPEQSDPPDDESEPDLFPPVPGGPDRPGPPAALPEGGSGDEPGQETGPGTGPDTGTGTGQETAADGPDPVTLETIDELVADGQASGDIREDVAQDLHQMIDNLRRDLDAGGMDLDTGVTELRDKVAAREQEGTLATSAAEELDNALVQLVS